MKEKGIIVIYTGDGRGKTTAALGLCMRGAGWQRKICIIQFFKSEEFQCGEKLFCKQTGIELYSMGIGYSWSKSAEEQRTSLESAWEFAKKKLQDESYDLVVLDEILHVFKKRSFTLSDILSEENLISTLQQRPYSMDVVLTGRGAGNQLIEFADMVTEMRLIKHPLQMGVEARKGMEY